MDLEQFSQGRENRISVREELGLGHQDVVVTCVAEFIPRKNHAFLLDAWKFVARNEEESHLLLVGEGRIRDVIESRVQQERIPRVYFLGFRRDVPRILAATDVFVLTSKHEGLARCIMEAMAAGKPVIATDVRGSRDLVEHGVTGLLVELGDVEGLAQALLQLIRDLELRKKMGQAGQDKIQDYSLERVLDEMSAIYARYLRKQNH